MSPKINIIINIDLLLFAFILIAIIAPIYLVPQCKEPQHIIIIGRVLICH